MFSIVFYLFLVAKICQTYQLIGGQNIAKSCKIHQNPISMGFQPSFWWRRISQPSTISLLAGSTPTPLKNMSSSVGMLIPNWMEKLNKIKTCSKSPTMQIGIDCKPHCSYPNGLQKILHLLLQRRFFLTKSKNRQRRSIRVWWFKHGDITNQNGNLSMNHGDLTMIQEDLTMNHGDFTIQNVELKPSNMGI